MLLLLLSRGPRNLAELAFPSPWSRNRLKWAKGALSLGLQSTKVPAEENIFIIPWTPKARGAGFSFPLELKPPDALRLGLQSTKIPAEENNNRSYCYYPVYPESSRGWLFLPLVAKPA